MERLSGKNVLVIIPRDYYNEKELDPLCELLKKEKANVMIASSKLKMAVGMKNGRVMPNLLIVDSIEGLTGDSYVMESGQGKRQIRGIFHGVALIGGTGARKYLWTDEIAHLLISDRFRSGFVVGAIGEAVPTLGKAGLLDGLRCAYPRNKHTDAVMETIKTIVAEDDTVVVDNGTQAAGGAAVVVTARGEEDVPAFAEAFIAAVANTRVK